MTQMPWMPWYSGKWLTSQRVMAMNISQEGAYRRLLDLAWEDHTCSLPADRDALKNLAKWNGLPDEQFEMVCRCFVPHPKLAGRVYNQKLHVIWKKQKEIHAVRVQKGREAAQRQWHGSPSGSGKGHPPVTQGNRIEKNREEEQKKKKEKKAPAVNAQDDQVWMNELKADVAYQGLDIDRERAKAERWCQTNHRTFTRRFFVNWLNRAEKPLHPGPGGNQAPARSVVELGMRKKP